MTITTPRILTLCVCVCGSIYGASVKLDHGIYIYISKAGVQYIYIRNYMYKKAGINLSIHMNIYQKSIYKVKQE